MTLATLPTKGYVIWEGPSMLDGAPIVAIALRNSRNVKTGNMVQTYIIRADVAPLDALRTGDDASVCGDCKHRPYLGGGCYVQVGRGPRAVFGAYTRGRYPRAASEALAELGRGRMVRLGTYGDPAAVPAHVWETLTLHAQGRTGYTHQWGNPSLSPEQRARITALCMASVDSPAEAVHATLAGLRYFRVHVADSPGPGEFTCPASAEAGKRKTCAQCGACDGNARGQRKANPIIVVHGPTPRRFATLHP